jgi:hypothetical protein
MPIRPRNIKRNNCQITNNKICGENMLQTVKTFTVKKTIQNTYDFLPYQVSVFTGNYTELASTDPNRALL